MNWTSGARDENDSSLVVLAAAGLAALVLAAIPVLEARGKCHQAPSGYLPDVSNVSVDLEATVPPVGGGWNASQIMLESQERRLEAS